jgi:HD-GYP domain-containing protein (c-di-GMP phosphodiesterase class II)
MKTEVIALKGKVYSKSFTISAGQTLTVGRGNEVDIQILDAGLSRTHCSLSKEGDVFTITDLGSRNGSHVNGERIQSRKLKDGDLVSIGGIEFQFKCGPDRRRTQADLIARIPERAGHRLHERLNLDSSDLMELPAAFQNVENYQRIQRDLATIYRVGNMISAEMDTGTLYERVLDAIFQVVNADRAFLILQNESTGQLETLAKRQSPEMTNDSAMASFSTTIVKECFSERTSILQADALEDEQFGQAESVIFQHIHSVLCVPVESTAKVIGVIYADNVGQAETFARHDLELLTAVGKQAGVAIQRASLAEQLRKLLYGSVGALVATIEAKDEYTRGHSDRVTAFAMQIGRAMDLNQEELATLELAGFLHDVGKIGVPESILGKPGPLTAEEFEIVKQHPSLGYSIVSNIEGAGDIAEVVRHHHERWDGGGYPDGRKENEASKLARILSVADAYDAMTSKRPYRDALELAHVAEEIRSGSGGQFDPDVVKVFLLELDNGRISSDDTAPIWRTPAHQGIPIEDDEK